MITIHLHKLLFHAYHGLYIEEQILGNDFEVSADIEVALKGKVTDIEQTINYATLYGIIKERMQLSTPLLETVAHELTEVIHSVDERIKSVSISIKKLSPPLVNFQGIVGVSYKNEF